MYFSVFKKKISVLRPYLDLCERMGRFQAQFLEGGLEEISISYNGEVSQSNCQALTSTILVGILSPTLKYMVNFVNAPHIAKERGIKVTESKSERAEDFINLISIEVKTSKRKWLIAGTLFGKKEPRIVRLDSFSLDAIPEGNMVFIKSDDSPGVIGEIGTYLGKQNININRMSVGQDLKNKRNVILLHTDISVPNPIMEGLNELSPVMQALRVDL